MRNICNKIASQCLYPRQLLRHAVEAVNDLIEAFVRAESADMRNANRKISRNHALRRGGYLPDWTIYRNLTANKVKYGINQTEQQYIQKVSFAASLKLSPVSSISIVAASVDTKSIIQQVITKATMPKNIM